MDEKKRNHVLAVKTSRQYNSTSVDLGYDASWQNVFEISI